MKLLKKFTGVILLVFSVLMFFTAIAGFVDLFNEPQNLLASLVALTFVISLTVILVVYGLKLWNSDMEDEPAKETYKGTELLFTLKELSELILADDVVDEAEAKQLLNFLDKYDLSKFEPQVLELYQVLTNALEDDELDSDEASELRVILSEICDRKLSRFTPKRASKYKSNKKTESNRASGKINFDEPTQKTYKTTVDRNNLESGEILLMDYCDSRGNKSFREVSFRSISKKKSVSYLNGICQVRGGYRTFRVDRIEGLMVADTGEIIENIEAFLS